ncbi:MAG: APC family permease, partial [Actinomycetota bacterium]
LLMVVWLVSGRASSTPLEADKIIPPFTGIGSIVLVVSNFIAFAGLEVNAVHVRRMRNPRRNYPKAIAVACTAILLMYVPGSIAISVAVPSSALDLNAGAPQAFHIFADEFGVGWLGNVLSGALVFGALAAAATWVAGPSRGLLLVGRQGLLPRRLQQVNDAGAQTAILVVQGCIVTVLALLFVALPDVSSAFWVLQAMTAVLYLTMYVLLFTTAVRLRKRHPEVPRGIRVPAIRLVAFAGGLASLAGIVIALFPPAQFGNEPVVQYAGILLVGVAILGLPPQLIYRLRRPSWRTDVEIEPEPDPVEPD